MLFPLFHLYMSTCLAFLLSLLINICPYFCLCFSLFFFSLHNILYSSFSALYTFILFLCHTCFTFLAFPRHVVSAFSFPSILHPTTLVLLFFLIFARIASINSIMQFNEWPMIAMEHTNHTFVFLIIPIDFLWIWGRSFLHNNLKLEMLQFLAKFLCFCVYALVSHLVCLRIFLMSITLNVRYILHVSNLLLHFNLIWRETTSIYKFIKL